MTIQIQRDSLTLGEIEQIEQLGRASFASIGNEDKPQGRLLRALWTVLSRRTDPKYAYEQSADVTVAQLEQLKDSLAAPTDPT